MNQLYKNLLNKPVLASTSAVLLVFVLLILLMLTLGQSFVRSALANETSPGAQPQLPTLDISIDGTPLLVELAGTRQQRFMGLSFRRSMPDDAGMLFVYQSEQALTFTMRNTLIPLSIAFISESLIINEIQQMDVGPGQLFPAAKQAQYALEVNQGWFARNGIKPGAQIVMQ